MRYVAAIDYEKNQLTLTNDNSVIDVSQHVKLPLNFAAGMPGIEAKIQGLPAEVFLSTGDRAALTVFKNFQEQHPKIAKIFARSKLRMTGYGASGPIQGKVAKVSTLEIAPDIVIKNAITRAPVTLNAYDEINRMDGTIGYEILRQFHMVFDYQNKFAYLKKNSSFGTPTKFLEIPNPELK